jgi:hypothetical protein
MWQAEETTPTAQECRWLYGLPVDPRLLFAGENDAATKRSQVRKTRLLEKMSFLRKFLQEDERVLFATTAFASCTLGEILTIGAVSHDSLKGVAFVFTDRRLFYVPTNWRHEYRGSVAEVLYSDCKSILVKDEALVLEYISGKTEKYPGVPHADGPLIMQIPMNADSSSPADDVSTYSTARERHHLCPKCTQALPPNVRTCPFCGLKFKYEREAVLQAIVLPGGGYFYANHLVMGMVACIVENYLMILMLMGALGMVQRRLDAKLLLLTTALMVAEKIISCYHARRFMVEFIPGDVKPLLAEAKAPAAAAPQAVPEESPAEPALVR